MDLNDFDNTLALLRETLPRLPGALTPVRRDA
jgi:hypothetical protein